MDRINEEMMQQLLVLPPEDILELINTAGLTAVIMEADTGYRIQLASALLGFAHKVFVVAGCQIETSVSSKCGGLIVSYKNGDRVT